MWLDSIEIPLSFSMHGAGQTIVTSTTWLFQDDVVCEIPTTCYLPDDLDPIYTYTQCHIHIHIYMYIYIHICTYIYLRARPRAGPWALGRVYVYVYVYVYSRLVVFLYVGRIHFGFLSFPIFWSTYPSRVCHSFCFLCNFTNSYANTYFFVWDC